MPRERLDLPFLKQHTASPYLVGAARLLPARSRRRASRWCGTLQTQRAVPYDTPGIDRALEGACRSMRSRSAPTTKCWPKACSTARPASASWSRTCAATRPSGRRACATCRPRRSARIAHEYLEHACVGETIEIDGQTLPYRPVAVTLGKTVNNGWGGYECCWARTLLAMPGRRARGAGRHARHHGAADRGRCPSAMQSVKPGPDGFMHYPMNPTDKAHWSPRPNIRNAYRTHGAAGRPTALEPGAGADAFLVDVPRRDAQGPAHASRCPTSGSSIAPTRRSRSGTPRRSARRSRASRSSSRSPTRATRPTTTADILLPDATDLESLQLIRIGGTKFIEQFWDHEGFALRQPAVADARRGARLHRDRHRAGAPHRPARAATTRRSTRAPAACALKGEHGDFSLDPTAPTRARRSGTPCAAPRAPS